LRAGPDGPSQVTAPCPCNSNSPGNHEIYCGFPLQTTK
jgi:hypothetical protein